VRTGAACHAIKMETDAEMAKLIEPRMMRDLKFQKMLFKSKFSHFYIAGLWNTNMDLISRTKTFAKTLKRMHKKEI
jgi:hypothetical protein